MLLAPKQAVKAVRCLLLLVSKRTPVRTNYYTVSSLTKPQRAYKAVLR